MMSLVELVSHADLIVQGLGHVGYRLAILSIQTTAIVLGTAVIAYVLRRRSAATRHTLWSLAFASVVVLPVLTQWGPRWAVLEFPHGATSARVGSPTTRATEALRARLNQFGILEYAVDTRGKSVVPGNARGAARMSSPWLARLGRAALGVVCFSSGRLLLCMLGAWGVGLVLLLSRYVVGMYRIRRLIRDAVPLAMPAAAAMVQSITSQLHIRRQIRVLLSERQRVPVMWGLCKPTILLPAEARTWSDAQWTAVLWHELAHIARFDVVFQSIGTATTMVFWFNPWLWRALRRLRDECEQACDDLVLRAGVSPVVYADCLVRVARAVLGGTERAPLAWAGTLAMARPAGLETRVRAILDPLADRRPLDMPGRAGLLAVVGIVTIPIAALRPVAKPVPALHGPVAAQAVHAVPESPRTATPASSRDKIILTTPSASVVAHPVDKVVTLLASAHIAKYIDVETALQRYWHMPEHVTLKRVADATTRDGRMQWKYLGADEGPDMSGLYTIPLYDYPTLVTRDTALADIFRRANFRPDDYAPTRLLVMMTYSILFSDSTASAESPIAAAITEQNAPGVKENSAKLAKLFASYPKLAEDLHLLNLTQQVTKLVASPKAAKALTTPHKNSSAGVPPALAN